MANNRFALLDEDNAVVYQDNNHKVDSTKKNRQFVVLGKGDDASSFAGYSLYLSTEYGAENETLTASTSVDAGANTNVTKIVLKNDQTDVTLIVRANGGDLDIYVPNGDVNVYGATSKLTVLDAAPSSVHIYDAVVAKLIVNDTDGHVVVESGATVAYLEANGGSVDVADESSVIAYYAATTAEVKGAATTAKKDDKASGTECTTHTPVEKESNGIKCTYCSACYKLIKTEAVQTYTRTDSNPSNPSDPTDPTNPDVPQDNDFSRVLKFTAKADNSSVTPNFVSGIAEYSTDGGKTWLDATNGTAINIANGSSILMRNKGQKSCETDATHHFSMTGSISASGDITSLFNGKGGNCKLEGPDEYFGTAGLRTSHMFYECTSLTSAPNLPTTTLRDKCYEYMFYGCTSLINAPSLPAISAPNNCYQYMFKGCTSLTTASALPATTIGYGSYLNMYEGCTSLTKSPALPASKMESGCYEEMFKGCTSLTEVGKISGTTGGGGQASICCKNMFSGCTSLKVVTSVPGTANSSGMIITVADDCTTQYNGMFDGSVCSFTNGTPDKGSTCYWYK